MASGVRVRLLVCLTTSHGNSNSRCLFVHVIEKSSSTLMCGHKGGDRTFPCAVSERGKQLPGHSAASSRGAWALQAYPSPDWSRRSWVDRVRFSDDVISVACPNVMFAFVLRVISECSIRAACANHIRHSKAHAGASELVGNHTGFLPNTARDTHHTHR